MSPARRPAAAPLLLELGCEELPAAHETGLARAFGAALRKVLQHESLLPADDPCCSIWHTPRRLAVSIGGVLPRQPDRTIEKRGPAVQAAFDADGRPTRAAEGFARSVGVAVEQLERVAGNRGEWLVCRQQQPGRTLPEVLQRALPGMLKALPMPNSMRWGAHELRFLRPLHWLLALHGDQLVPLKLAHLEAGACSYGHRVHAPGPVTIATATDYLETLRKARVEADPEIRKASIRQQLESICSETRLNFDKDAESTGILLEQVNNLVEWPVAVLCAFDPDYLQLPEEVLVLSMRSHQKFFPLYGRDGGRLSHRFIAITNLESKDPVQVRHGHERVIAPRLADARFFWNQDRRRPFADYRPALAHISFQRQLGSLADKSRRMQRLAGWLAGELGADARITVRAAELALCDLGTDMVGEFPELQGTMGRYYALASGEPEAVATAIEEHYRPRSSGDRIAATLPGQCLAIAEKCDRLLGIFAAGKKPAGSKDPFALRRAAIGLARTLVEAGLRVDIDALLAESAAALNEQDEVQANAGAGTIAAVRQFLLDRLQGWLQDTHGISVLTFRAVAEVGSSDFADMLKRMQALQQFSRAQSAAAASLATANKRIVNLLLKSAGDEFEIPAEADGGLFEQAEEKALHRHCRELQEQVGSAVGDGNYQAALKLLAGLQQPVDDFFDYVLVMTEDTELRRNRLALLYQLRQLCNQFADISLLAQRD